MIPSNLNKCDDQADKFIFDLKMVQEVLTSPESVESDAEKIVARINGEVRPIFDTRYERLSVLHQYLGAVGETAEALKGFLLRINDNETQGLLRQLINDKLEVLIKWQDSVASIMINSPKARYNEGLADLRALRLLGSQGRMNIVYHPKFEVIHNVALFGTTNYSAKGLFAVAAKAVDQMSCYLHGHKGHESFEAKKAEVLTSIDDAICGLEAFKLAHGPSKPMEEIAEINETLRFLKGRRNVVAGEGSEAEKLLFYRAMAREPMDFNNCLLLTSLLVGKVSDSAKVLIQECFTDPDLANLFASYTRASLEAKIENIEIIKSNASLDLIDPDGAEDKLKALRAALREKKNPEEYSAINDILTHQILASLAPSAYFIGESSCLKEPWMTEETLEVDCLRNFEDSTLSYNGRWDYDWQKLLLFSLSDGKKAKATAALNLDAFLNSSLSLSVELMEKRTDRLFQILKFVSAMNDDLKEISQDVVKEHTYKVIESLAEDFMGQLDDGAKVPNSAIQDLVCRYEPQEDEWTLPPNVEAALAEIEGMTDKERARLSRVSAQFIYELHHGIQEALITPFDLEGSVF